MKARASAMCAPIVMLLSAGVAAQTAPTVIDRTDGVSLEQAITMALADEPYLRAARSTIDVARAARVQAGVRRNPSISTDIREDPAGSDNQTMVNVEWPLDLFRRKPRAAVADQELHAAELAVADRERLLIAEVRARYGDTLVAVRDLGLLEELVETTRRQRDLLQSRVAEGATPPIERDLVGVDLQRMDAERVLQLGRVERAVIDLKRVLGMTLAQPLRLRESLDEVVMRESALPASPAAENARADVLEASALVTAAEARIDRAERDGRVDVRLFAGYMRMNTGFSQLGLSPAGTLEPIHGVFHYLTGGATVTLPFFDRNQGGVAAARAEHAGAIAMQEAVALSVRAEIAAARTMDGRARDAVRLYGGEARALARENLSVVRQSHELGRTTIFDVLAEQKRYLDLERGYTETLRAAYEARTALNRATGER